MASLKDIINLCTEQEGKVFVVNDEGEVQFVLLSKERFEELANKPKQKSVILPDPELVNKQILKAQLEEVPETGSISRADFSAIINRMQKPLPADLETKEVKSPRVDLREEVIDPSFDFDSAE